MLATHLQRGLLCLEVLLDLLHLRLGRLHLVLGCLDALVAVLAEVGNLALQLLRVSTFSMSLHFGFPI